MQKKRNIRPPKAAAVVVTPPATGGVTLTQLMTETRRKIRLEDLGIAYLRPKIAATGAMLLEVPGENCAARVDQLATRLREALAATGANVARPVKCEELRIAGLDKSVSREEAAAAVAAAGVCDAANVRVGDIRRAPSGLETAWLQCLAAAAKKVAAKGRITMSWVSARVEVLSLMRCFKCLEMGHTRSRCTAPIDRLPVRQTGSHRWPLHGQSKLSAVQRPRTACGTQAW